MTPVPAPATEPTTEPATEPATEPLLAVRPEPPQLYLVPAGTGPVYLVAGEQVTFKALAADTGGAYSLIEKRTTPGQGFGQHALRFEDEAFLVLEGEYTLLLAEQEMTMSPGDFAFIPRGMRRQLSNSGPGVARVLVLLSPGGLYERFLAEVGEYLAPFVRSSPAVPIDPVRFQMIASKYGIEISMPSDHAEG